MQKKLLFAVLFIILALFLLFYTIGGEVSPVPVQKKLVAPTIEFDNGIPNIPGPLQR